MTTEIRERTESKGVMCVMSSHALCRGGHLHRRDGLGMHVRLPLWAVSAYLQTLWGGGRTSKDRDRRTA